MLISNSRRIFYVKNDSVHIYAVQRFHYLSQSFPFRLGGHMQEFEYEKDLQDGCQESSLDDVSSQDLGKPTGKTPKNKHLYNAGRR